MSHDPDPGGAEESVWHEGERVLQAHTGMRERWEERGRVVIRDHMPDQHRQFFTDRNQLFLSTLDAFGQPWATIVEGEVGFITSPTPRQLLIAAVLPVEDPASSGFYDGASIGALGLEFETRRRNRMNGIMRLSPDARSFSIEVVQSFGNCPKYIQSRNVATVRLPTPNLRSPLRSRSLTDAAVALISTADTFFIASRSTSPGAGRSEGLDLSHRGGKPGFVLVTSASTLVFPDYRGNFAFNTLGNLHVDPRCSLLFIDFTTGATLQLAGQGQLVAETDFYRRWPGAERAVQFRVDHAIYSEQGSRLSWHFLNYAPQFE